MNATHARGRLAMVGMGMLAAVATGGAVLCLPGQALAQARSESEEIIVTARRREESLQRVPIAVSAFAGASLSETHVQTFADLASIVPGPTFVPISGASGSQMMIRGQYASDDSPAFDTPVGVFIDDIYYGSVASFMPDFYDVEQVAVLRGPQGTTFGRNTVGGALQITSRRPSTAGFDGQVSTTLRGNENGAGFETTGHVNVPFTETFAGRLAYNVRNIEGDIHNVTTGENVNDVDIWSVRGSALWAPSSDFELLTSLSYTRDDSLGDGPVLIGDGALIASLNNPYDSGDTYIDDDGSADREIFNGVVRAQWNFSWGSFVSITGYRSLDANYREDIDGSPVEIAPNKIDINDEDQFSQEFRIVSASNQTFEWVAGLYYLNQSVFRSETYTFGADPSTFIFGDPWRINGFTSDTINRVFISGDITTESIAPFGEVTWNLNDEWAITAGARYTYDSKENVTTHRNLTTPGASTIFFGAPKLVRAEESWDAWTPRLIVEYQPTDELLLYASASQGFKSGGFNYAAPTVAQAETPILPEESTSYEIGSKMQLFDGRLRLNAAAYETTTVDLQVRSLVGTVLQVNNAGEARVRGLELELAARPTGNLAFGLNYAYTDAEYTSYEGCAAGGVDCSGNAIPFVPENTFFVFGEYTWDLANDSAVTLRVEDSWADAYEVHIGNENAIGPQDPRPLTEKDHTINAFLTYEAPGGDWRAQAWGRNLTDERHVTFATNYFFYLLTSAEAGEASRASVSQGRSYGVTATFNFN